MSSESWGSKRSSGGTVISRAIRGRLMKKKNKADKTNIDKGGKKAKKAGKDIRIDLIEQHRLLSADLDDLTIKVERLVTILVDLRDRYVEVKDFTCVIAHASTYSELLQEAVDTYNSSQYQDMPNINISHNAPPGQLDMIDIVKLAMKKRRQMVEARSVRGRYQNMSQSAQLGDAPYDDMELTQLQDEIQALQNDIHLRNLEIAEVDEKLHEMQYYFTEAKKDWCWKRAGLYKTIILNATVDCM